MISIAVIDGKGGGIGKAIIQRLKSLHRDDLKIIALGTNAQATLNMLKAGADDGATGENAIVFMSGQVDIIVGPVAIISANAMMGEISPLMSEAISRSNARKLLIPMNKCHVEILGTANLPLKQLLNELVSKIQ